MPYLSYLGARRLHKSRLETGVVEFGDYSKGVGGSQWSSGLVDDFLRQGLLVRVFVGVGSAPPSISGAKETTPPA